MKKVGLIIQGPLISFGKSGRTATRQPFLSSEGIEEDGLIRYDCRSNIQKIINDFGKLFTAVVISTWDNELRSGDEWKGAAVVPTPDPGGVTYGLPYTNALNNRNREFIGIRHGLAWLKEHSDAEYVVRIRTDQYMDLRALLDSFGRHLRETRYVPGMICVSFMRPSLFHISHFYFAAELHAMDRFLNAQLDHAMYEFIVDVHRDMILKYAYSSFRDILHVPDWAYFPRLPRLGINKKTKTVFSFMLHNVFVPLSRTTWHSVVWRGSAFGKEYMEYMRPIVMEEDLPLGMSEGRANVSIPALFSINWKRYYEFCRITKNTPFSWKEKYIIWLGEAGWSFWIFFQRVMRIIRRTMKRI